MANSLMEDTEMMSDDDTTATAAAPGGTTTENTTKATTATLGTDGTKRVVRAPVACAECHKRKVRCNVAIVGNPCSNCWQDGTSCVLHVSSRRKRHLHRSSRRKQTQAFSPPPFQPGESTTATDTTAAVTLVASLPTPSTERISITSPVSVNNNNNSNNDPSGNVEWVRYLVRDVEHPSDLVPYFIEDYLRSWGVLDQRTTTPRSCGPHLWVPRRPRTSPSPAEMAFYHSKGALSLPTEELQNELVAAYFTYVQPMLPVVDMTSFWQQYEQPHGGSVGLLLLQSMFFVASNYVGTEVCQKHGLESHSALKKIFYDRAKVLFDLGFEQDKATMIQSALLLGYWYENTDEIADSWHWIGVACSLGQTIGLHRNPSEGTVPPAQRRFWRRLWWCCFHRDRWLALGMGRCMRINQKDCDVEVLGISDLIEDPFAPGLSNRAVQSLMRYNRVAALYVRMIKLSLVLGDILAFHYSVSDSAISLIQSQHCERSLQSWYREKTEPDLSMSDDRVHSTDGEPEERTLQELLLDIFYQVVTIVLYRARLSRKFYSSIDSAEATAKAARSKCWTAASAATDSFRKLVDLDMIPYLPPESVSSLMPITSILYTQRFWVTGLRRQAISQKLDLCLMVMKAAGDKLWGARSLLAYFLAAFERLETESSSASGGSVSGGLSAPILGDSGGGGSGDTGNTDTGEAASGILGGRSRGGTTFSTLEVPGGVVAPHLSGMAGGGGVDVGVVKHAHYGGAGAGDPADMSAGLNLGGMDSLLMPGDWMYEFTDIFDPHDVLSLPAS